MRKKSYAQVQAWNFSSCLMVTRISCICLLVKRSGRVSLSSGNEINYLACQFDRILVKRESLLLYGAHDVFSIFYAASAARQQQLHYRHIQDDDTHMLLGSRAQ
jgi:hypothetical protein